MNGKEVLLLLCLIGAVGIFLRINRSKIWYNTDARRRMRVAKDLFFGDKLCSDPYEWRSLGRRYLSNWRDYSPVFFWIVGGLFTILGFSYSTATLNSTIFSVLSILLTYELGRTVETRKTG